MRRAFMILLLLLLFSGLTVQAQDTDTFANSEIIKVLMMGDGVFEPSLWLANASENLASTSATWQSRLESGFSGLSFLNYYHFDTGYTLDSLDQLFDDDWFNQLFVNWEDLHKTGVCYDGDVTLHEFTLSYRDDNDTVTPYVLRYWVDPMTDDRVRAWYISFATANADGSPNAAALDLLDQYSARMYPDLPSCPR